MRHLAGCLLILCACGSVSADKKDAGVGSEACVAQTDTELCAAMSACEMRTITDNCGMSRAVDCGACASGMGCVTGTCKVPECRAPFTYTTAGIPNMSRASVEDSIGAATPDASVILYVKTESTTGCGLYHLVVADEVSPGSGTYTQQDAFASFNTLGMYNGQDGYSITPNGLTIITMTADRKTLVKTTRSAKNMIDFSVADPAWFANFGALTLSNNKIFVGPTLSPDGLEFWVTTYDQQSGAYAIHFSVRADATAIFPAPTPAYAPVSTYPSVEGISADRLALIVFDNYSGRVLTRNSTSGQFTNPNAPGAPPQLPAWDQKPLAGCTKMVAMTSPGGCANEDVVLLTKQ
jgi:hypothetical protein